MRDRMRAAEYLFDELGLISDPIIAEAIRPVAMKKRGGASFRRVLTAVAAAAVIVTLSASLLLVGLMGDSEVAEEDGVVDIESVTLEDTLERARDSEVTRVCGDASEIGLFDGETKLVWQSAEGGDLYVISVTDKTDADRLHKALERTYALSESVPETQTVSVRVWVCYGDGRVVSPYLRRSEGNVGYGELFEYSPEIMPAEELAELANDLIS